ncbi:hypothetical protein [Acinetobacter guillouiae]|uniref:hypothetical protein n=1 Tax=Acinetobacter guillouiae TaxID=106649 RepID=UPI001CD6282A|nr:hypothetical protein [Acinetobacter guillouiae]
MAMKQTQTKMFDFSDIGLDFCAGSKNLFPDRFKKMLAQGYNTQTVSSVVVTGNQVVLTYGVNHGYAADRVLKLNAANLTGEYVIDSVTSNTVTITIDNAPTTISGGFITFVAPLGWQLMYEQLNIHVYKMKHIDDTDRYVRLCFQDNAAHRNAIAVCIGKTFDLSTGFINDPNAFQLTKEVMTPSAAALPRWDGYEASNQANNYTYAQGYSNYGKAMCVGSLYHFAILACWATPYPIEIYGILPVATFNYEVLSYPIIIARKTPSATSSYGESNYGNFYSYSDNGYATVGNIRVVFENKNTMLNGLTEGSNKAISSVLSSSIDSFNTTTAMPLQFFERATSQHLGFCYGAYMCLYGDDASAPLLGKTSLPLITKDIDFNSNIVISNSGSGGGRSRTSFLAFPIEEIKIA